MFDRLFHELKTALLLLTVFMVLTGLIYPAVITLLSQILFPQKANGSLVVINGEVIGSELIGQSFTDPKYFWGRPSATTPFPYNAFHSSGSNLGPTNPVFLTSVQMRMEHFDRTNTQRIFKIPVDLVTASGSGLDPDISPLAAIYQINRIAHARKLPEALLYQLVLAHVQQRTWRLLGERRINVLALNLALDQLEVDHGRKTSQP